MCICISFILFYTLLQYCSSIIMLHQMRHLDFIYIYIYMPYKHHFDWLTDSVTDLLSNCVSLLLITDSYFMFPLSFFFSNSSAVSMSTLTQTFVCTHTPTHSPTHTHTHACRHTHRVIIAVTCLITNMMTAPSRGMMISATVTLTLRFCCKRFFHSSSATWVRKPTWPADSLAALPAPALPSLVCMSSCRPPPESNSCHAPRKTYNMSLLQG